MIGSAAIPVHLAVHLLGLATAAALAVFAMVRREQVGRGWGSLAAGGLLLAASHVLAGALVTTSLEWPMYLRVAGYAGLAVGGAGGLGLRGQGAVVPGLAPVAAPAAHLVAGVAGVAAAFAALRGVLRPGGVILAAGFALWAAADVLVTAGVAAAATASVAGSLLVGLWLVSRSRESLPAQVAVSYLGAVLLLLLGFAALSGFVLGADLERDELEGLERAAQARALEIEVEWSEAMLTVTRLFAQETLAAVLAAGDEARLESIARSIAELPDTDVVVLLDADRRVVASFEWAVEPAGELPPTEALLIAEDPAVGVALEGSGSRGVAVLGGRDIVAIGASPVYAFEDGEPRRDQLLGVIVAGRRVASPVFVDRTAAATDAGVTLVIGGAAQVSSLEAGPAADIAEAIAAGASPAIITAGGEQHFLGAASLGSDVAWIALSRDAAEFATAVERFTRSLFSIAAAGLIAALAIALWASQRLTSPLLRLTATAERVASGDLRARSAVDRPDEVGALARTFDDMTSSLSEREERLRRAAATEAGLRERFEVLTSSMEEALVAAGSDGRVQTVNPSGAQLLGASRESIEGRPLGEVLVGVDDAGGDLLSSLGGPESADVRAVRGVLHLEHGRTPVAATAAPLRGDGEGGGRVYVMRDVTDEAQVERMKSDFLANISHELRTPLTPIKGYAEVLRHRHVPPGRVAEFAANIAEATDRLERIVGMLVDFAALEAGRLDVRPEPTQLDGVVAAVLETWRERYPDRRFSRHLERDLPPVHVDPDLLGRTLEELVDNAVKFSDGPVRIRARREDDRLVRLTVADDGAGIEEEQLTAILEDFRQADSGSTRRFGGLGLGLSLVSRITQRFGAEVVVRSEVERGTEVDLLLAVAEEDRP